MLPKRVLIVRHGESIGNNDKSHYLVTPDWKIPLTTKGQEQALACGVNLAGMLSIKESVGIYHSPWVRAAQTTQLICNSLRSESAGYVFCKEDPRLQEQNYSGRLEDISKEYSFEEVETARSVYGKFWYRLSNGENFSDVFNRIANFWVEKRLDWLMRSYTTPDTLILVCHGATSRVIRGYLEQLTSQETAELINPDNCEIVQLIFDPTTGKYNEVE